MTDASTIFVHNPFSGPACGAFSCTLRVAKKRDAQPAPQAGPLNSFTVEHEFLPRRNSHGRDARGTGDKATNRTKRRGRAFTLIEVLATLLLMAIVLPCVMHGFTLSTAAATTSRHRTEAGALAESKLNELVGTAQWQTATQGDFSPDWPDYTWSSTLSPWGQGQGAQGTNIVQQLDVKVSWKLATGEQSVTVSTLVYQSPNATGTTGLSGGLP